MEDRVVLSTASLRSHSVAANTNAEVFRIKKAATQLAVNPAIGLKGDTISLVATLTSNGSPLVGQAVRFQVRGRVVGKATTDAQGIATLSNVKLKGISTGVYPGAVAATFAGNAGLKLSNGRGGLIVSRFASTLSNVAGGGFYGGNGSLSARLSSNGAPVSGQYVSFSVNGNHIGDVLTDNSGIASLDGVSLVGTTAGVHANAVTASFGGAVRFGPSASSGALTLTPLSAAISLGSLSQTYNGSVHSAIATTSPSNLATTISYTDANGNPVSNPKAAGSYTVTATINDPNYSGTASGTLVIATAQLTASGITAGNKAYDGTTVTSLDTSAATLAGVIAGDNVTLNASAAIGNFNTKAVGTGKPVTVSGLSLTGPDATDYSVIAASPTANITQAALTVSGITANDKPYDGTTSAILSTTNAALVGVVAGDVVTLVKAGATGTFDTSNIGTGKTVTVNGLTLSGTDAGNYTVTQPTTTANITQGLLTVTGITASNKVYDGTTSATLNTGSAALVGVVAGDDVTLVASAGTGTFDTKNVGTGKTVTVSGLTLSGADADKYTLVQPTTTANISVASLTVTGVTASNKVYDGTTSATIDIANAALVGIIAGDDVALNDTGATGTFDTKDVGTGKTVTISNLLLTGADAANYGVTPTTTTADITAVTLTVTRITAVNKTYDETTVATLDTNGATLVGVIAGDTVTLDNSSATDTFDTKDVGTGKTVAISGLLLAGADAGNYILTQPTTTADILAATTTVTGITASNKRFDGNTDATLDTTGALLVGVVPGDDVTLDVAGAIGTFDTPDIGADKTVSITGLTLTGADSGNYSLTQPTTTASIT